MNYTWQMTLGAEAKIWQLFRYPVNGAELAAACGALEGAAVRFSVRRDWLYAKVTHPYIVAQERSFRRQSNGALYVYNHELTKQPTAPAGLGALVVTRQVWAAQALGCLYIEMWAAGDRRSASRNGYYTWGQAGF